jgi:hypothetical protein
MTNLPQAAQATHIEVLTYVDTHSLFGRGSATSVDADDLLRPLWLPA